jgi:hypothetical protein
MKSFLSLEAQNNRRVCMKHLKLVMVPYISVLMLAAILPQHTQSTKSCGAWNQVTSPNAGTSYNILNGVAAISARNVWAVGAYGNGNGSFTLVEHWTGKQWKVVASPNVKGSLSDSLSGIVAIATNNIWAVGSYIDASNTSQTLIEHWNGSKWSIVSSPNVSSAGNSLAATSAVSATDIWAVGTTSGNSGYQTLIEHWNGSNWSIVSSSGTGQLAGVAAIASNNAWAVGYVSGTNGIQTLIEHWNGSAWSVVNSSGPGLAINMLNGVTAITTSNVWAVGEDSNSSAPSAEFNPLIEHWNGSNWSIVNSPLQGNSDSLNGVAAVSSSNIWAVGDYRSSTDPTGPYFTLIEHWNGSTWKVVTSPSPGSVVSDLVAVARVPATKNVWAVGYTQDSTYQTLTMFHC